MHTYFLNLVRCVFVLSPCCYPLEPSVPGEQQFTHVSVWVFSQGHWVAAARPCSTGACCCAQQAHTLCRQSLCTKRFNSQLDIYLDSFCPPGRPNLKPHQTQTGRKRKLLLLTTFRASLGLWTARSPKTRKTTKTQTGPEVQVFLRSAQSQHRTLDRPIAPNSKIHQSPSRSGSADSS